jgi:hypothetical protein
MKKIMNWVLAATLVCGSTVFTSCSSNEDSPSPAEQSKKDRKEFVAHTRQTLKYMAENMNFGSWEAANTLNQKFNEYVLNNSEFQKAVIPLFLQKIQESIKPVEEGSELAEMGYKMYATVDLTDFNYRFTMKDDMSGFDVEPAEDFEIILSGYNPATQQVEKDNYKLTMKTGSQTYSILFSLMSNAEFAVVGLIPEDFAYAISDKLTGNWRDVFTGAFINLVKNSDPSKIIVKQNDGFTISGTLTSTIPSSQAMGKAADATTVNFLIDSDHKTKQGTAFVGFEQNGQKLVDLDLKVSVGEHSDLPGLDLTLFNSSGTSIIDLLSAVWGTHSLDEGKIILLDDLETTVSISNMAMAIEIANEMAKARRNYADQQTMGAYADQLNELISCTMICKGVNQTIPMRMVTTKIGVDWWAMPGLNFADENGYVAITDMLDKESVEYGFNLLDHAVGPMQQSIITVRQLIQFVRTYLIPMQKQQGGNNNQAQ